MLLIDPSLIRERLTLEDKDEINEVLKSAVAGATPSLEAMLQTTFQKGSAEDVFVLSEEQSPFKGFYQLRLSSGFVRLTPDVKVSVSESFFGDYVDLPDFLLQAEKGVVKVPADLKGKHVKVTYDHGFTTYKEVPEWLREVALAKSVQVLSMNAVNDKKDELSKVFAFIASHTCTIMDSHLRTGSFQVLPV